MRALLIAAPLALAACAGGIPTPASLGAPEPAVILPAPEALPTAELCAYADELEAALAAWQAYVNAWAALIGREPPQLAEILAAREEAAEALALRAATCAPAPAAGGAA